jgi:hypothetical protein
MRHSRSWKVCSRCPHRMAWIDLFERGNPQGENVRGNTASNGEWIVSRGLGLLRTAVQKGENRSSV